MAFSMAQRQVSTIGLIQNNTACLHNKIIQLTIGHTLSKMQWAKGPTTRNTTRWRKGNGSRAAERWLVLKAKRGKQGYRVHKNFIY